MRLSDVITSRIKINTPFIIAEIGVNHEGSLALAKRQILEAKEGGAHAVKFQSYKAGKIAVKNSPAYWDQSKESTPTQFELFKKFDSFGKAEFNELYQFSCKNDIEFLSTPFDIDSADYLCDLMDVFKISSSDITNKPFIEHLCDYGKPILMSTGASTLEEISRAVNWITAKGVPLSLMHCVLNYPTLPQNANLHAITTLRSKFPNMVIGYSDHTVPDSDMLCLRIAHHLGALIIEKHFTHDKTLLGNDHYHSMDTMDLQGYTHSLKREIEFLGDGKLEDLSNQADAILNARRSLVLTKSKLAGEVIQREDLTWKRPASGIPPFEIENLIGKTMAVDLEEDSVLQSNHLK
jgi:sialic acid synthase SpsE